MGRKVFHFAVGVKDLDSAIEFYRKVFPDIEPDIRDLPLGTGRVVKAAQWYSDYINFFLFEGCEISHRCGLDHIGIQFDDEEEMNTMRRSLGKEYQRYFADPFSKKHIELFPNVIDPPEKE